MSHIMGSRNRRTKIRQLSMLPLQGGQLPYFVPPPKRRVQRTPKRQGHPRGAFDEMSRGGWCTSGCQKKMNTRTSEREGRHSDENVMPHSRVSHGKCTKGSDDVDWKRHVRRSSLMFEQNEKDSSWQRRKSYKQLFRKIARRFREHFPRNDAEINASVCCVELLLGDVRGFVLRKDFKAASSALILGLFDDHAAYFADAPAERGAHLVEIVHSAWALVFCCAKHTACSERTLSRAKRFLRELRHRSPETARASRKCLRHLPLSDSARRSHRDDASIDACELESENLLRTFESLCLCYNKKYKIRERIQFQPISEWLLLGIPGNDPAHDRAALYGPEGARSHWTKTTLPNGARVYKKPLGERR